MDYNHGTGHGVGYCLGVHEFPPTISKNSDSVLMIGQLLSNEPGYYIPRKFGIRLENLILVKKFSNSIRKLSSFGYTKNMFERSIPGVYDVDRLGYNFRMSEVSAAIGSIQLSKLKKFLKMRSNNSKKLRKLLNL